MIKKASLPLTTLLALVTSLFILIPMGLHASSFFGHENPDKSPELPLLHSKIISLAEGKDLVRSLDMDEEDLFMFFNKGSGHITLKYNGDESKRDLIFNRPEMCLDTSCVCYCRGGPYWRTIKDKPFLDYYGSMKAGEPYTCSQIKCEKIAEDIYFTNSRGSSEYSDQITHLISEDNYVPISMDIFLLLNQFSIGDWQTVGDAFFKKSNSKYSFTNQNSHYLNHILGFKWEGGYVLGGYGISKTKTNRNDHTLTILPASLRLEKRSDGIVGICIHKQCLLDEDLERIALERKKARLEFNLANSFETVRYKIEQLPTCFKDISASCTDTEIQTLFLSDYVTELQPELQFSQKTIDDASFTIISLKSKDKELYGTEIQSLIYFTCVDEKSSEVLETFSLSEYEGYVISVYKTTTGSSCKLEISKRPVASKT